MKGTIVRVVWRVWEALFRAFFGVRPLVPGESHLFLIATRRYRGRPFSVDGIDIRRGDRVIELHLNNEMVLDLLREEQKSLIGTTVKLLREAQHSLPILAQALSSAKYEREHVLYGVTFIHRGIGRLGFHTIPLGSALLERVTAWHLRNIFEIVNPQAKSMLETHPDAFVPKMVAMSKERLIELHLQPSAVQTTEQLPDHALV